jgi:hypothetical protein
MLYQMSLLEGVGKSDEIRHAESSRPLSLHGIRDNLISPSKPLLETISSEIQRNHHQIAKVNIDERGGIDGESAASSAYGKILGCLQFSSLGTTLTILEMESKNTAFQKVS